MSENIPELKTAAEITASLQGTTTSSDPDAVEDPRDAVEYSFTFSHKDVRGKVWAGKFLNRILSIKQRRLMKITKAQMSGGVPVASLDADTWELNEMIAHLAVSLDATRPEFPDWASNLEDLYDEGIIVALYGEVASHEARFYRRESALSAGERPNRDRDG